ncbi:Bacterial conjugation TrbI-like protein [compost metagenome]
MNQLQKSFSKLSPNAKRMLAIGGTVIGVCTVLGVAMSAAGPEEKTRTATKPPVNAVLTDEDPRGLGLDSVVSQLKALQSQQSRLERVIGQREKDETVKEAQEKITSLEEQMKLMEQELARMAREGKKGDDSGQAGESTGVDPASVIPARVAQPPVLAKATTSADQLANVYANQPPPPPEDPKARTSEKKEGPKIRTIRKEEKEDKDGKKEDISITLPSGSILSGVLVTGMDAPTGKAAQKDPFPSLIRIKTEAILPNRFRADFRECFLIAAGWGDLSSERAYMRAERLSCVRNDGSVLESSLDAYASGEDGKAGIRGRLVSKQGQILARSLMAGFMQGVAGAFDVRQVPSINITRSGNNDDDVQSPVYEQAFDQNAIQAAGVGGVGSALERIADFYLEMAENIFPVIEIDAMREVDFIVKKGMTVKFNETTLKVSQTN